MLKIIAPSEKRITTLPKMRPAPSWQVDEISGGWLCFSQACLHNLIQTGGGSLFVGQLNVGHATINTKTKTMTLVCKSGRKWFWRENALQSSQSQLNDWSLHIKGPDNLCLQSNISTQRLKHLVCEAKTMTIQGGWSIDDFSCDIEGKLVLKSSDAKSSFYVSKGLIKATRLKNSMPVRLRDTKVSVSELSTQARWIMRNSELEAHKIISSVNVGLIKTQANVGSWHAKQNNVWVRHGALTLDSMQSNGLLAIIGGKVQIKHHCNAQDIRLKSGAKLSMHDAKVTGLLQVNHSEITATTIRTAQGKTTFDHSKFTAKDASLGVKDIRHSHCHSRQLALCLDQASIDSTQFCIDDLTIISVNAQESSLCNVTVEANQMIITTNEGRQNPFRVEKSRFAEKSAGQGVLQIYHPLECEHLEISMASVSSSDRFSCHHGTFNCHDLDNTGTWKTQNVNIHAKHTIASQGVCWHSQQDTLKSNQLICQTVSGKKANMNLDNSKISTQSLQAFGEIEMTKTNLEVGCETLHGSGIMKFDHCDGNVSLAQIDSHGDLQFHHSKPSMRQAQLAGSLHAEASSITAANINAMQGTKAVLSKTDITAKTLYTATKSHTEAQGLVSVRGGEWQHSGDLSGNSDLSIKSSFYAEKASRTQVDCLTVNGKNIKVDGILDADAINLHAHKYYEQNGKVTCKTKCEIRAQSIAIGVGASTKAKKLLHSASRTLTDRGSHQADRIQQYAMAMKRSGSYQAGHYESYALASLSWGASERFTYSNKSSIVGINLASLTCSDFNYKNILSTNTLMQIGYGSMSLLLPELMGLYTVGRGLYDLAHLGLSFSQMDKSWSDLTPEDYLPAVVNSANAIKGIYGTYKHWRPLSKMTWPKASYTTIGKQCAWTAVAAMGTHSEHSLFSVNLGAQLAPTQVRDGFIDIDAGFCAGLGVTRSHIISGQSGWSLALRNNLLSGKIYDTRVANTVGLLGGVVSADSYEQHGRLWLNQGSVQIDDYTLSETGQSHLDETSVIAKHYESKGQVSLTNGVVQADTLIDQGQLEAKGQVAYVAKSLTHEGSFTINPEDNGGQSTLVMQADQSQATGQGNINGQSFQLTGLSGDAAADMVVGDGHGAQYASQEGGRIQVQTVDHLDLRGRENQRNMEVHAVGDSIDANGFDGNGHGFTLQSTGGGVNLHGGSYVGDGVSVISAGQLTARDTEIKSSANTTLIAKGDVMIEGGSETTKGQSHIQSLEGNATLKHGRDAQGNLKAYTRTVGADAVDDGGNVTQYAAALVATNGKTSEQGVVTQTQGGDGTILNLGEETEKIGVFETHRVEKVKKGIFWDDKIIHTEVDEAQQAHNGKSISVASKGKNISVGANYSGKVYAKAAQGNSFRSAVVNKYEGTRSSGFLYSASSDRHYQETHGGNIDVEAVIMEAEAGDNILGGKVRAEIGSFSGPNKTQFVQETLKDNRRESFRGLKFMAPSVPLANQPLPGKIAALNEAEGGVETLAAAANASYAAVNAVDTVAGAIADGKVTDLAVNQLTPQLGVGIHDSVSRIQQQTSDGSQKHFGALQVSGESLEIQGVVSAGHFDGTNLDRVEVKGHAHHYQHSSQDDAITVSGNPLGVTVGASHNQQAMDGVVHENAQFLVGHAAMKDGAHIEIDAGNMVANTMTGKDLSSSVKSCQDSHQASGKQMSLASNGAVSYATSESNSLTTAASSSLEILGDSRPEQAQPNASHVSFRKIDNIGGVVHVANNETQTAAIDHLHSKSLVDSHHSNSRGVAFNIDDVAQGAGLKEKGESSQPAISTMSFFSAQQDKKVKVHAVYEGGAPVATTSGDAFVTDRAHQQKVLVDKKSNLVVDVPITDKERLNATANKISAAKQRLFPPKEQGDKVLENMEDLLPSLDDDLSPEEKALMEASFDKIKDTPEYKEYEAELEQAIATKDSDAIRTALAKIVKLHVGFGASDLAGDLAKKYSLSHLEKLATRSALRMATKMAFQFLENGEVDPWEAIKEAGYSEARAAALKAGIRSQLAKKGLQGTALDAAVGSVGRAMVSGMVVIDIIDLFYDESGVAAIENAKMQEIKDALADGHYLKFAFAHASYNQFARGAMVGKFNHVLAEGLNDLKKASFAGFDYAAETVYQSVDNLFNGDAVEQPAVKTPG